jgi:hypothetical protein
MQLQQIREDTIGEVLELKKSVDDGKKIVQ